MITADTFERSSGLCTANAVQIQYYAPLHIYPDYPALRSFMYVINHVMMQTRVVFPNTART
jgi:hypothetical protein